VSVVQPVPPAKQQLARRLRELRQQQWPGARLTQEKLATALNADEPLTPVTVSSWESLSSPKLPPARRLLAYARFFATPRSVEGDPRLLPLEELTEDEQAAYKKLETELLSLRSLAAGDFADQPVTSSKSWSFNDTGRVTFVCAKLPDEQSGPLADPSNPNYTELQAYADLDALMELHGHIRAENPLMTVYFRIPSEVQPDDLTGHVILIGGVAWNEITEALSEMANLPVRQVVDPELPSGDPFVAEMDGNEKKFWPKWADAERKVLLEDVGLLARVPNPLNSSRTLTICNGIFSRGVYGAVRSLTDAHLRNANENFISAHFGHSDSFAMLMSVKVIRNQAMTPDFNSDGVVLYEWPQDIAA
jgi:transcriptional regulator with XRE-family HTH domain